MVNRREKYLKKLKKTLFTLSIAGLLAASSATAAVIVEASNFQLGEWTGTTSGFSESFTTTTASNSVLFVMIGGEFSSTSAVSFNGQNATPALASESSGRNSYIYAIDLGSETGATADLEVTGVGDFNTTGFSVAAVQVSNADFSTISSNAGLVADGSAAPFGSSLSGLSAGSFVIGTAGLNGFSFPSTAGDYTPTASGTQDVPSAFMITAYQTNVSGNFDAFYTNSRDDKATFANASIAAIPEPSTFALMAGTLGLGLVLLRRRRR